MTDKKMAEQCGYCGRSHNHLVTHAYSVSYGCDSLEKLDSNIWPRKYLNLAYRILSITLHSVLFTVQIGVV